MNYFYDYESDSEINTVKNVVNADKMLSDSIENRDADLCEKAIKHGANVNMSIRRDTVEFTALQIAVKDGLYQICKLLLDAGAKTHFICKPYNNTVLHCVSATGKNNYEICKLLLEHGANSHINFQNREGSTPVYLAALYGHNQLVEMYIAYGANINTPDKLGMQPIHAAAIYNNLGLLGNFETFNILISNGANINSKDYYGLTPLHYAVKSNKKDLCEYLVLNGADINIEDNKGMKPIDYCHNNRIYMYLNHVEEEMENTRCFKRVRQEYEY